MSQATSAGSCQNESAISNKMTIRSKIPTQETLLRDGREGVFAEDAEPVDGVRDTEVDEATLDDDGMLLATLLLADEEDIFSSGVAGSLKPGVGSNGSQPKLVK